MDASEIKKKKRIAELNILSDVKTNIHMLETMSGVKVANIELKLEDTGNRGRPVYKLVDVKLTMEL